MARDDNFSFEITEHIGVLKEGTKGWRRELNRVSYNGASPKLDIRDWDENHEKMGKGITLTDSEAKILYELLGNVIC